MFRLICRKLIQNASSNTTGHHHHVVHTQTFKFSSNISTNYHSPTVSYFVQKFGLSLDSAISISKKMRNNIESTEKPDSVLQLFKDYGFTQTQITSLITKCPRLLFADPVKSLKPKFEFFESLLGLSQPDLTNMILWNKGLLLTSLRNHIIPIFNLLKSLLDTNDNILAAVKQCGYLTTSNLHIRLEPNIAVLRHHGVPQSNISKLIMLKPMALLQNRFNEILRAIEEMGFDSNSPSFVHAISVMGSMNRSLWKKKVEVYKSFGWSEEDAISAFKLQPRHMVTSEKKIRKLMNFYLNELRLQPSDVAKRPNLMMISLEKRIIPRCSVMQVLLLKGLIEKDLNLMTALLVGNTYFENKFVSKYQEIAPELSKAYKGELGDPNFERLRALLRI